MKLIGKKALVTGSNQGIGQAIALRLAEEGADLVIDYVTHPETAAETVQRVQALGRRAVSVKGDIGNVTDTQRMVAESVEALGVLNINLKGAFFATQAFVKHRMQVKQSGKVINVSSVHEDLPFPHFTSYCASKGGMKMVMRNLSIELAPLGITINNIAPGAIETPINTALLHDPTKLQALLGNIPLARLGKTSDIAGVAAFLASSDADYITGATIVVDGGLTWNYSEQ
jgi:glucose 1-dehydrogenase